MPITKLFVPDFPVVTLKKRKIFKPRTLTTIYSWVGGALVGVYMHDGGAVRLEGFLNKNDSRFPLMICVSEYSRLKDWVIKNLNRVIQNA